MAEKNIPDDRLPQALIDELKRRDAAPDAITSRVDRTLANAARAHFGAPRTVAWHRPGAWAAAAASAVLAVGVVTTYLPDRDGGPVYADVDRSGRIDIADVLALAREGVAQAELDAFARRVVALDPDGTP